MRRKAIALLFQLPRCILPAHASYVLPHFTEKQPGFVRAEAAHLTIE